MGSAGAILGLTVFIVLGMSIWGLFNNGRSILAVLAGIVTTVGAAMGALHAWGESQSIPWTIAYLLAVLIGFICILRQAGSRRPAPQPRESESSAAAGDVPRPPT